MNQSPRKLPAKVTFAIIGLLIAWSVLLAIGTFDSDHASSLRPLFIVGTIGSFVAIWWVALWNSNRE